MIDRVLNSPHTNTAIGFFAAGGGLFMLGCLIVGIANVMTWIARVI